SPAYRPTRRPIAPHPPAPTTTPPRFRLLFFFFFNYTAPTDIYTLSLHDALPICQVRGGPTRLGPARARRRGRPRLVRAARPDQRSEEHTSELQSRGHLVCRLLLEKKKESAQARPSRLRLGRIDCSAYGVCKCRGG